MLHCVQCFIVLQKLGIFGILHQMALQFGRIKNFLANFLQTCFPDCYFCHWTPSIASSIPEIDKRHRLVHKHSLKIKSSKNKIAPTLINWPFPSSIFFSSTLTVNKCSSSKSPMSGFESRSSCFGINRTTTTTKIYIFNVYHLNPSSSSILNWNGLKMSSVWPPCRSFKSASTVAALSFSFMATWDNAVPLLLPRAVRPTLKLTI